LLDELLNALADLRVRASFRHASWPSEITAVARHARPGTRREAGEIITVVDDEGTRAQAAITSGPDETGAYTLTVQTGSCRPAPTFDELCRHDVQSHAYRGSVDALAAQLKADAARVISA
jgi:hypothetical protein